MKIKKLFSPIRSTHPFIRSLVMAALAASFLLAGSPYTQPTHPAAPSSSLPIRSLSIEASTAGGIVASSTLTVHVSDPSHPEAGSGEWILHIADQPQLIASIDTWRTRGYLIDTERLARAIDTNVFPGQRAVSDIDVRQIARDGKVLRAETSGIARSGFSYDADSLSLQIADAIERGQGRLEVTASYREPVVRVTASGGDAQTLTLLSTGLSNYSDSPPNRIWNITKATDEKLNGIVVPQGATFSFDDALDPPVTLRKGWKEDLGLFGGGTAKTPGAGVCQVATTTYRAALLAGLPIVEKRNHSMWVGHYERYGIGLDATVFPGTHDLRFTNDTAGPLLIQSRLIGDDVVVQLFGIDDHRTVTLEGPYFFNTPRPPYSMRDLSRNEIGWMRRIAVHGEMKTEPIVASYYLGYFRSLRETYAGLPGTTLLTNVATDTAKEL